MNKVPGNICLQYFFFGSFGILNVSLVLNFQIIVSSNWQFVIIHMLAKIHVERAN